MNLILEYPPLTGLLALSALFALAWARSRRTGNAGIVDVLWTASLGALALYYGLALEGWGPRRALVTVLAVGWSARLTWHLVRRYRREPEDGRYARLRTELGDRFERWTFWFFQAQGALAVLLSLAFFVPASAGGDAAEGWRVTDGLALLIWLTSIAGESVADRQLAAWRAAPANRGLTCRRGLWRFSRHPNYFFEWMHWLVYPLMAAGLDVGWRGPALWAIPLLMLFLVVRVTGIPPTEEQALASRGDDYRAYQRTTNAFFPGPPRSASAVQDLRPQSLR